MEFKMFKPLGLYVKRQGYGWYLKLPTAEAMGFLTKTL